MLDARTTQDLTGASSPERSDVLCDVVVWRQSFLENALVARRLRQKLREQFLLRLLI